ncbi:MAG: beta-ketoacyl-ACP synthase III [Planctomycetota bacterium]
MKKKVKILGTGSYLPEQILSNLDFEELVDTSDEWITTRTGIKERRIAAKDESTSTLATIASQRAIEAAGISAKEIDTIILGTITPDSVLPATACYLQKNLGCREIPAFDLTAACSGFLYAIYVGKCMIESGNAKKVLAIGAECLSRITDYQDRGSCILFGDGAGAVILGESEDESGFISFNLYSEFDEEGMMVLPAGGSKIPATEESVKNRLHYMRLKGRDIFRFAVTELNRMLDRELSSNNITMDDIKYIIPHQVNMRILEAAAERFNISINKMYTNLNKCGNTSAASIPIALDEAVRNNSIKSGDLLLLVAFGGGKTWGSSLIRY